MRRQRRTINYMDEGQDSPGCVEYQPLPYTYDKDNGMQLDRLTGRSESQRFENTLEAKVEDGDTLQALALRFHCSVSDIKRINKIDKDNEIFARKVVKIPLTVHSVLLGTLPAVHKSGNNSPKQATLDGDHTTIFRNPLEDARIILDEKLLVASVNAGGSKTISNNNNSNNNNNNNDLNEDPFHRNDLNVNKDSNAPLLDSFFANDDEPQLRPIRGPALTALDCSGSDCDISWVFLFVVILALCFVIPLLYVFYLAEHPPHRTTHAHNISIHSVH